MLLHLSWSLVPELEGLRPPSRKREDEVRLIQAHEILVQRRKISVQVSEVTPGVREEA